MELHVEEGRERVNLLLGDLSFTLNDGYIAILELEERRVYEEIINSNVGVNLTTAFEGGYLNFPETSLLVKSIPFNYIKTAASTGSVGMERLLAARGASATHHMKALETAVTQNLPEIAETLLQYDVDPSYSGGTIF